MTNYHKFPSQKHFHLLWHRYDEAQRSCSLQKKKKKKTTVYKEKKSKKPHIFQGKVKYQLPLKFCHMETYQPTDEPLPGQGLQQLNTRLLPFKLITTAILTQHKLESWNQNGLGCKGPFKDHLGSPSVKCCLLLVPRIEQPAFQRHPPAQPAAQPALPCPG